MDSDAAKYLHMSDLEVDDDEWQMSAWFIKDQEKDEPLAVLDMHSHVFAVTGVFRAREKGDEFVVLSRDDFHDMFGLLPDSFGESDIGKLTVCPFEYDANLEQWTSTLTDGHPLVFHFAGDDWLCACPVLAAENYQNVPPKFRSSCEQKYDHWSARVTEAIRYIAKTEDSTERATLHFNGNEFALPGPKDQDKEMSGNVDKDRRQLSPYGNEDRRQLSPYGDEDRRQLSPYGDEDRRQLSPYGNEDRRQLSTYGDDDRRQLSPYGNEDRRQLSPYGDEDRRQLSPYGNEDRRQLSPYGDDDRRIL
jgi:hypothetical protein